MTGLWVCYWVITDALQLTAEDSSFTSGDQWYVSILV
jgi:hypothetical protein